MQIKSRLTGELILEIEGSDLRRANLRRANLQGADLRSANLRSADLRSANLRSANLQDADLQDANLQDANLQGADLRRANLQDANFRSADLRSANLKGAYLQGANFRSAYLQGANFRSAYLQGANFRSANLRSADLQDADLRSANLRDAKGLVKLIGVEPGNYYWKRFDSGLRNNGFQFKLGLNTLRDGEIFASDDCILCSFPGFHFASRSWCAVNYADRPLEARIRIPEDAQINEPWATDGKASADKIEILQVFDTRTGEDITDRYRRK